MLGLAGLDELREEADFIGREVLAASVGFFPADAAPKDAMPVETDDGRDARAWLKPVPG